MRQSTFLFVLLTCAPGCGPADNGGDTGGTPDTRVVIDTGTLVDSGTLTDTRLPTDVPSLDVPAVTDTGNPPMDARASDTSVTDVPSTRDVHLLSSPGMVFCFTGPDGGTQTCSGTMQVCCDTRVDGGFRDTCVANLAACPAPAKAVQCDEAGDCTTGQICCGHTGVAASGTPFLDGSICATACAAPNTQQLCSSDTECTGGTHCNPQHVSGRDIGYCM